MNNADPLKNEIMRLIMDSYDRGGKDRLYTIIESLKKATEASGDIDVKISDVIESIEKSEKI